VKSRSLADRGAGLDLVDFPYRGCVEQEIHEEALSVEVRTGAGLSFTELTGINLAGANLTFANLTGAKLDEACGDANTVPRRIIRAVPRSLVVNP
jgi:uncharacterized protein YjbI with pentapeptide repeats